MQGTPNLTSLNRLAAEAARAGGQRLRELWRAGRVQVNARTAHDVKLQADLESEAAILDVLRRGRPGEAILTEESGVSGGRDGDGLWIIDPLDGTVNFSHRHPHFAVSVAWAWRGEPRVGVVYDPLRDELFEAHHDGGARCNGVPVGVSAVAGLAEGMVVVGYGKDNPGEHAGAALRALAGRVQKLRISGSAALDVSYIACGRLDAYCEHSISVWDVAAAAVILREAGGACLTWAWPEPLRRRCLATNGHLETELLSLLGLDPAQCAGRYDR
ncbi:MAG: Inositol-1-monophosphatase [Lentisphaerae bacterium ADurb.BinA184]|nr:MAG: Inositol-1-monophosphatase [Lentisphaerae bacterium ADurb.BinA184]